MRISSLTFLLAVLFSAVGWSGTVSQVKGQKLIIQMEGEDLSPGTQIFVISSSGKKIGLVTIRKVKGTKALGEITKGRANPGDSIQVRGSASSSSSSKTAGAKGKHRVGAMLGLAMNSMTLTVQHPTTASINQSLTMKDNTFNAKGFYDYKLSEEFNIRGSAAYESFAATGTTSQNICNAGASTECSVSYSYLGLEGSAQYNYIPGKSRYWVGLGYSFLLALSKSNNIPNLTDSSTNQMILIQTGADFGLGKPGTFIPVSLEYGMFPGSSNVNANSIIIRGGYGFTF